MSELLEFLFQFLCEFLVHVIEVFNWWRFFLSLLLAIGITAAIWWLIPNDHVAFGLSIATIACGCIGGIAWERQAA